ncbi:MAG: hypothetical protein QM705_05235 [Ancrocorticia sp.]
MSDSLANSGSGERRRRVFAGAVAALLLVAGVVAYWVFSNPAGDESPGATASSDSTSVAPPSEGTWATPNPEATPIPVATEHPDGPSAAAPKILEATGDVIGKLGEPSGMVGANGQPVFTVAVTEIRLEPTCPTRIEGETFTADAGKFLVARVEATMDPSFPEQTNETPFVTVDSDTFSILDGRGEVVVGTLSQKAHGCFSLEERIQPFVNPGESVTGLVVLESSVEHGYLQYNPWGVPGSGWVWEF